MCVCLCIYIEMLLPHTIMHSDSSHTHIYIYMAQGRGVEDPATLPPVDGDQPPPLQHEAAAHTDIPIRTLV